MAVRDGQVNVYAEVVAFKNGQPNPRTARSDAI